MKTGIIIHSHTNNTLSVGERLLEALQTQGQDACLERVIAVNEDPNAKQAIVLKEIPDISPYDFIVIGAPVRAFSLSPMMNAYLSQLSGLKGKRVACFVTQHFPRPWMGGNRSIRQMIRHITRLGGIVTQTAVVNWTGKMREEQVGKLVSNFTSTAAHGSEAP